MDDATHPVHQSDCAPPISSSMLQLSRGSQLSLGRDNYIVDLAS